MGSPLLGRGRQRQDSLEFLLDVRVRNWNFMLRGIVSFKRGGVLQWHFWHILLATQDMTLVVIS